MADIGQRKRDHLELCATGDVGFRGTTTLLECVKLVHDALPELHLDDVDLSVTVLGKRLRAPILIAAMTGGTAEAAEVNRALASLAEARGYAFGVGSQRAMHRAQETSWTYAVRDLAPTCLLLGNVGMVQARELSTEALRALAGGIGADALCVHLNPAMELVQPGGDRDFRGGAELFRRVVGELGLPVVAKETGNGIGPRTARALRAAGVRHLDVSGAGGTSWVGVETLRAEGGARRLGEALWDWGVPTAVAVHLAAREGFETVFATGGVGTGLDVARALSLGAHAGGIARPLLKAFRAGGRDEAERYLDGVEQELRALLLLTGSRSVEALRRAPRVLTGELRDWLGQLSNPAEG
ncbi:MAG: type 2 isopentenyl-diphosphate Delta-isomerase [Deltaproteobacteria bacterium]|nr:type 2 isopentenyl-diphosphate Delta-isomerase [Deltaproteobacteria bacterium]